MVMAIGAAIAQSSQSEARDRRACPAGKRIGRPFVGERNRDGRELGRQQQHHGADHAQLQVAPVGRPDIGPQMDDGRSNAPRSAETRVRCQTVGGGDGRSFRTFI